MYEITWKFDLNFKCLDSKIQVLHMFLLLRKSHQSRLRLGLPLPHLQWRPLCLLPRRQQACNRRPARPPRVGPRPLDLLPSLTTSTASPPSPPTPSPPWSARFSASPTPTCPSPPSSAKDIVGTVGVVRRKGDSGMGEDAARRKGGGTTGVGSMEGGVIDGNGRSVKKGFFLIK